VDCTLYGLHPTAPVLSHGATKKQGNSVKWSVLGNSQLTILWQTLGKKRFLCLTLVNYFSVTIVVVGGEL